MLHRSVMTCLVLQDGRTALMLAADSRHAGIAEMLVDFVTNLNEEVDVEHCLVMPFLLLPLYRSSFFISCCQDQYCVSLVWCVRVSVCVCARAHVCVCVFVSRCPIFKVWDICLHGMYAEYHGECMS